MATRKKYQKLINIDFIKNQFKKVKNLDFDMQAETNSNVNVVDLDLGE